MSGSGGDASAAAPPVCNVSDNMRHTVSPALSHFQRAAFCYQQTRYVEAIRHYLAGLKFDMTRHHIYADLAKAYEMVGEWDRALSYLDIALRLSPDSPTALRRKARLLQEKQGFDALIRESGILHRPEFPNREFLNRLEKDGTEAPKPCPVLQEASSEYGQSENRRHTYWRADMGRFILICDAAMSAQTVWYISQLVRRTSTEVGKLLRFYPTTPVVITITNTGGISTAPQNPLPRWASGCYDGQIRLTYRAEAGEPVLGILYALLRHEWTHLLIHRTLQHPCPRWLDEGLAQHIARPMFPYERHCLQQAVENEYLLPFAALNQPFGCLPAKQRKLAYLQSVAIVEYLIKQFSFAGIRQLLCHLNDNVPIELAVVRTFDKKLAEIPLAGSLSV